MLFGPDLLILLLPQVESPIPERIGLGLPVTFAGVGGMLLGFVHVSSPPDVRDRWIRCGGLIGFLLGVVLYLALLVAQLCCSS